MAKLIMVVDDNPSARTSLQTLFEAAGYPIQCAENGQAALDYLRRAEPPGLILLDLRMPVMDGWEFRRQQLNNPALAAIPVMVISSETNLSEIAASLRTSLYFSKPIKFDELLRALPPLEKSQAKESSQKTEKLF